MPWPDVIRRAAPKRQDELAKPVFVQPAPNYSWFVPFAEPLRKLAPRRQADLTAPVATIPQVIIITPNVVGVGPTALTFGSTISTAATFSTAISTVIYGSTLVSAKLSDTVTAIPTYKLLKD